METQKPVKSLIGELRRRRVLRTAALYIVGAWLVMQVGDIVFPALGIPERSLRYVLFGALLGFPAVIVFGWFFDVGPHGISRTRPVGPNESGEPQALRASDYVLLAAFLAVAVAIIYSMADRAVDEQGFVPERAESGPPMVAVLPFTATSMGGDNEFFANGVHDDLLTRLAQLQSLRVISRTSVLEYRNTVRNIREIGARLGADVILEGGIQSAGDRIRINAQLIDARTDEHLWAHTYDRDLTAANIFDVQTEIARAIASAMHSTLTPQDVNQLAVIPTENMAAYREYLRAVEIRNTQRTWKNEEYGKALERAVELDPLFTRAMAELVGHLAFINFFHEEDTVSTPRAEVLLESIRALAPNSADHLMAKFYYTYYALKDYPTAYELIKQAESMRPSDIRLLEIKTYIQRRLGVFDERIETVRKLIELDPLNARREAALVWNLAWMHRYDEALAASNAAKGESYPLSYWRSVLDFREHRDIARWLTDLEAVHERYGNEAAPMSLWEARIAARDFSGAEKLTHSLRADDSEIGVYMSEQDIASIITAWSLGDDETLAEMAPAKRAFLEQSRGDDGEFINYGTNLELALIAASEGKTEEAERLVRIVLQEARKDMTDQTAMLADACQILGMAGAVAAAVDCLRTAFTVPSMAHPFLEPYLPYYDSIREDPAFRGLLAEIE
jgi:TolB-like protein